MEGLSEAGVSAGALLNGVLCVFGTAAQVFLGRKLRVQAAVNNATAALILLVYFVKTFLSDAKQNQPAVHPTRGRQIKTLSFRTDAIQCAP